MAVRPVLVQGIPPQLLTGLKPVLIVVAAPAGQRRAHLLLRAEGHDARHPGDARAGGQGQRHLRSLCLFAIVIRK